MKILGWTALLAVAACSEVTAPQLEPTLAGRYELASVNSGGLPCVVMVVPPEIFRWRRGVLILREDGTFVDSLYGETDARPFGALVTDSSAVVGEWESDGNLLILRPTDRGPYTMARDGNHLARFIPRQHLSAVLLDLTLRYEKH